MSASSAELRIRRRQTQRDADTELEHVLALSERLRQTFFAITFVLATSLDGHVESSQMMLEFEVDGSLGGRQVDHFHHLHRRDLVDLGDILDSSLALVNFQLLSMLPVGRTGRGRSDRAHGDEHAILKCAPRGTNGTSRRLAQHKSAQDQPEVAGHAPVCSRRRFFTCADWPSPSSSTPR